MTTMLAIILLLYAVGILLIILDILLIPTSVTSMIGGGLVGTSIFLMFKYQSTGSAVTLFIVTAGVGFGLARLAADRYTLQHQLNREDGYVGTDPRHEGLRGKAGVTLTPLRPAGKATIDGLRVDVVSRGPMIGADEPIVVVEVEGNRVVVKPEPPAEAAAA